MQGKFDCRGCCDKVNANYRFWNVATEHPFRWCNGQPKVTSTLQLGR